MHKNILIGMQELLILREAFYSCQISGINEDITFEEYLEQELIRRRTKNKFKLRGSDKFASRKQLAESLDGDNKYVGDFYIPAYRQVWTVFKNACPNRAIGHKDYPFFFFDDGICKISAFDTKDWEKIEKVKI